jgi:hypothetical protein
VRILFRDGMSCFRIRKRGERKRKSVRGCIVSADLSVLNLVVVKKGAAEIEGLTDKQKPRRLGPKRASKIRKLFNLEKGDDVRKYVNRHTHPPVAGCQQEASASWGVEWGLILLLCRCFCRYVIRREIVKDGKKTVVKAPKIQRLVRHPYACFWSILPFRLLPPSRAALPCWPRGAVVGSCAVLCGHDDNL